MKLVFKNKDIEEVHATANFCLVSSSFEKRGAIISKLSKNKKNDSQAESNVFRKLWKVHLKAHVRAVIEKKKRFS